MLAYQMAGRRRPSPWPRPLPGISRWRPRRAPERYRSGRARSGPVSAPGQARSIRSGRRRVLRLACGFHDPADSKPRGERTPRGLRGRRPLGRGAAGPRAQAQGRRCRPAVRYGNGGGRSHVPRVRSRSPQPAALNAGSVRRVSLGCDSDAAVSRHEELRLGARSSEPPRLRLGRTVTLRPPGRSLTDLVGTESDCRT